MKTLIIPTIVAALLFPIQTLEAKGKKTYGGFKKNYKFSFKVEEIVSSSTTLTGIIKKAKIPRGVPKYRKGEKVKFKILNKGTLKAKKGLRIPFTADGGSSNVYNKTSTGNNPKTDTATVFKGADGKASGAALNFIRVTGKALSLKTYSLTYTLR